jgi:hypothetical protein
MEKTATTTQPEAEEIAAEEIQKNTLTETVETVAAELAAEEHQKRIATTAKLKRALAAKDVDWRVATQSVGVNPDSLPDREQTHKILEWVAKQGAAKPGAAKQGAAKQEAAKHDERTLAKRIGAVQAALGLAATELAGAEFAATELQSTIAKLKLLTSDTEGMSF